MTIEFSLNSSRISIGIQVDPLTCARTKWHFERNLSPPLCEHVFSVSLCRLTRPQEARRPGEAHILLSFFYKEILVRSRVVGGTENPGGRQVVICPPGFIRVNCWSSKIRGCRGTTGITGSLESVQDFLIKLYMKLCMHLVEIGIFSLNHVIVRLTKIMNNLVELIKIHTFKVIFLC